MTRHDIEASVPHRDEGVMMNHPRPTLPLTVEHLMERLQAEIEREPVVAQYAIIWDNTGYTEFEVRHEGRWVRLPGCG